MLHTALCDLLSIEVPIIGAPMYKVGGGRLAAAISAAGGLGMIAAGNADTPESIAKEAMIAKQAGKPYGIGLMAWVLDDHPEMVDATVAQRPDLVSVSFGSLAKYISILKEAGLCVAAQVGTPEEAIEAIEASVDILVARGGEGGGHGRDEISTLVLLQVVLELTEEIPVVAAGGIATPSGLAAVLAAGAAGAWIGTPFLTCAESATTLEAKQRILRAGAGDTISTRVFDIAQGASWPVVFPGRALRNQFTAMWHGNEEDLSNSEEARETLMQAVKDGDYDKAFIYAGQSVGLAKKETTAAEFMGAIVSGAEVLLNRFADPST